MENLGIDYDRRVDVQCETTPNGLFFGTTSNLNFHGIGFGCEVHIFQKPEMWFSRYLMRFCVSLCFITLFIDLERIFRKNGELTWF